IYMETPHPYTYTLDIHDPLPIFKYSRKANLLEMIISTNKTSYPDPLIVILDQDKGRSKFTEKDQVTRVENEDGEVIGFNFFNVSSFLDYDKLPNGEVKTTQELVDALNKKIAEDGFDNKLEI